MICLILALVLAMLPLVARAQTEEQTLVDRSTLAIQDMLADPPEFDARNLLRKSKGVMICPRVFKAGFIFGAQGGGCIMVGRLATSWTGPAFYGMGSGSFGLQAGIQDSEILFIILTDRGLRALLDSQFKIGADAGVAIATIGAGVSGSTTAAFGADIVAFARSRGLYAGMSLRRQPDRRPQRLEPGLLRPAAGRPADRAAGRREATRAPTRCGRCWRKFAGA